jgi:hypothetical protein
MTNLPERANLAYLKKQAKDLIRLYRDGNPEAITRFREALPTTGGRSDEEIAALGLRLHDAQSCVARSYGFASWADLRSYVEVQSASRNDHAARVLHWLRLVYSGDVDGRGIDRANPRIAARMLAESPDLAAGDPYLACAIGDEDALQAATKTDPGLGQSAGRAVAIAAARRNHARESVPSAGVSRTPVSVRETSALGRRRSEPADRPSLASGVRERAGR